MAVDRALLHRFPALIDLGPRELKSLSMVLESARYRRGAQLCREGDEDDRCFFLVSGTVGVNRTLPDGRRLILAELPEGIVFGQSGLVQGQYRTAEVRANTDVEVLELRRLTLEFGLRNRKRWAMLIQQLAAVSLVRQLRGALAHLEALAKGEREMELLGDNEDAAPKKAAGLLDPQVDAPQREPEAPLPPIPTPPQVDPNEASMTDLMNLLAETEATLGDLSSKHIRVVIDDDQRRRSDKKN